jgi:DNA-binding IclR family transcriptional regulator
MGRKALEPLPYKPRISKLMKAILKELGQASGMRVSELTHSLKVPRPSISRSLSTLVRSGNATYTMEGKSRIYKLVEKKDSKQVTGD